MSRNCKLCNIVTGSAYLNVSFIGYEKSCADQLKNVFAEFTGHEPDDIGLILCRTCHASVTGLCQTDIDIRDLRAKLDNALRNRGKLFERLPNRLQAMQPMNIVSITSRYIPIAPATPSKVGKRQRQLFNSPVQENARKRVDAKPTPEKIYLGDGKAPITHCEKMTTTTKLATVSKCTIISLSCVI